MGGIKTGTPDSRRWSRNLFNIIVTKSFTLSGVIRNREYTTSKPASLDIREETLDPPALASAKG